MKKKLLSSFFSCIQNIKCAVKFSISRQVLNWLFTFSSSRSLEIGYYRLSVAVRVCVRKMCRKIPHVWEPVKLEIRPQAQKHGNVSCELQDQDPHEIMKFPWNESIQRSSQIENQMLNQTFFWNCQSVERQTNRKFPSLLLLKRTFHKQIKHRLSL